MEPKIANKRKLLEKEAEGGVGDGELEEGGPKAQHPVIGQVS